MSIRRPQPANHGASRAPQLPANCDKAPAINHAQDRSSLSVRWAACTAHLSHGAESCRRIGVEAACSPRIFLSRVPPFEEEKKEKENPQRSLNKFSCQNARTGAALSGNMHRFLHSQPAVTAVRRYEGNQSRASSVVHRENQVGRPTLRNNRL